PQGATACRTAPEGVCGYRPLGQVSIWVRVSRRAFARSWPAWMGGSITATWPETQAEGAMPWGDCVGCKQNVRLCSLLHELAGAAGKPRREGVQTGLNSAQPFSSRIPEPATLRQSGSDCRKRRGRDRPASYALTRRRRISTSRSTYFHSWVARRAA